MLDTCALLWLAQGGGELSKAALQRIEAAPLELPARPVNWFAAVLEHHDIEVLPLALEVCICAPELPAIHADSRDRMIIAAAKKHRSPVVTTDPLFS